MTSPIKDLNELITEINPVLHDGVYVFVSVNDEVSLNNIKVIASIHESEGYSAIIAESDAKELGLDILFRAAWITLNVHSDLNAIGLTALFSAALAKEGISCNVVAGAYHDHVFVPVDRAKDAMHAFGQLQQLTR